MSSTPSQSDVRLEFLTGALVALSAALTLGPADASALTVAQKEDRYELSFSLLGQAEYGVRTPDVGHELQYGPSVSLARFKGSADWVDVGQLDIQIGGADGTVRMVDMVATVDALDPVSISIGRFKTPVLAEFLVSARDIPLVDRTTLNGIVPRRRVGVQTGVNVGELEDDGVEFTGQLGLFQPQRTSFTDPRGQLFTARVLLALEMGLNIHAAFAEHVFASNTFGRNAEADLQGQRVVELERPLDFAVFYDKNRVNLHAESVIVLNSPGSSTVWGVYGHAAYRLGKDGELNVEPAVGYDYLETARQLHRITAGANLYLFDTGLVATANYRLRAGTNVGHEAYLQLQGSL